jgi:hypothetical protein
VTDLLGFFAGELQCPRNSNRIRVFAPILNGDSTMNGAVDWYVDYVWRWTGSSWVAEGYGPWSYKDRGLTYWRQPNGTSNQSVDYLAQSNHYYAVVQFVWDGQFGAYWPQQATNFFSPNLPSSPTCLAG